MTKIVFMGTPDFAVPSLTALISAGYAIAAAVTQPDRPQGRKRELAPPPVKIVAERHGIPVLQPERIRDPEAVDAIRKLAPDLIVTAAYGQILPKALLDLPRLGCINVHGSLLPKYRGGAPIQHALMNGEEKTGVTIMYMAEGLDTGDMISKIEVPIGIEDDAGTLFDKLSAAGADLLVRTLPDLIAGRIRAVPQNDAEATYARTLTRDDERIDWSAPALTVYNRIRALRPRPGAYTLLGGETLKIWRALPPAEPSEGGGENAPDGSAGASTAVPGTVLKVLPAFIEVAAGDGPIRLTEVQPAGKKAMPVADFINSGRIKPGMILGGGERA